MKKSKKSIVAKNVAELAEALGLTPADGAEIELRVDLNRKIVEVAKKSGLTHAQIAKLAGTSRTRVTGILNLNTHGVSTDLMLRILGALGYRAKVTIQRAEAA